MPGLLIRLLPWHAIWLRRSRIADPLSKPETIFDMLRWHARMTLSVHKSLGVLITEHPGRQIGQLSAENAKAHP